MKEFGEGVTFLHRGIREFYRAPRLWRYALAPMAVLLLLYAAVLILVIAVVIPYFLGFLPDPENWSVWLRWLIHISRILIALTVLVAALLTGAMLACTLFEVFGGPFFDELVSRFERERYGTEAQALSFRENLSFLLQSLRFSLGTLGWSMLLFPAGLLIPLVGILPAVLLIGYRQGLSYLFSCAFLHRIGVRELRQLGREQRGMILGFGVAGYLWLLIPFAAIFLLPGFLLGGTMLFREKLFDPVTSSR